MKESNCSIRAFSGPWNRGIDVLLRKTTENQILVAQSVEFKEVDPNLIIEPTLQLSINEAQVLIDDLWQAGLRPSEGSGSAGSLKATENHLQDMRKIAFKTLRMNQ